MEIVVSATLSGVMAVLTLECLLSNLAKKSDYLIMMRNFKGFMLDWRLEID